MHDFTLQELQCFEAVATAGGFQAAAAALHRTHPAVFSAVAKLERQLGFALFDRSGYRVQLTEAGRVFHQKAGAVLRDMQGLRQFAAQLAAGEESELRVIVGDFAPPGPALGMLSRFFNQRPHTRLHLDVEAVGGPVERLLDGSADLIIHGIDKHDTRLEWLDLGSMPFVPVAAAGYLPFPVTRAVRPDDLRDFIQAVIRDTARHSPTRDHFMIAGAQQCSVPDQLMKKELILQGMAWGHLPRFLVEKELRQGKLVALTGRHLKGSVEELVAARRADREHGPVAQALWEHIRRHGRLTVPIRTPR